MTPDDPVVARLRHALDELTAGAEPTAERATPLAERRARNWRLPSVAAACAVLAVGAGTFVIGGGGGTNVAAPTPTGAPVPTAPPVGVATIPWYGITGPEGIATTPPIDGDQPGRPLAQVWAAPDYSRVLVATAVETSDAMKEPKDWPVLDPIADVPSGVAWAFSGDEPVATWHGIYWAPDDDTAVSLSGYGFGPDDLAQVLQALTVERTDDGPRVVSALSSLAPLPDDRLGYYSAPIVDAEAPMTSGYASALFVARGGLGRALAHWSSLATAIATAQTPFGPGVRIETADATHVWWPVDGGPYWAGVMAPPGEVDALLARVVRVGDVAAPAATSEPFDPAIAPTPSTDPPMTSLGAGTAAGRSDPSDGDIRSDPTLLPTTAPPATVSSTVGPAGGSHIVAVGESVMLSAARAMTEAGIRVVAQEAIQAPDVAAQVEQLRDTDQLGDAVVVQVGTNGTLKDTDLDRIMAALAGVERVAILTVHADRAWIAGNNDLIRALPARYPDVRIVDWDRMASQCECLAADGIHVVDAEVYVDAITATLD